MSHSVVSGLCCFFVSTLVFFCFHIMVSNLGFLWAFCVYMSLCVCLSYALLFYFVFLFFILFYFCFFGRAKLDGQGGRVDLGVDKEGQSMIEIYCMWNTTYHNNKQTRLYTQHSKLCCCYPISLLGLIDLPYSWL